MNVFTQKLSYGDGKDVTLETGKLARQAHGAVVLTQGKMKLLATVVSNKDARDGVDFLPMSVDYQEKFAAGGRIPGGFLRREGRLSNAEILVCRIVDRTLRPLFPNDYHAETQVMIQLMSADVDVLPDALVALAASAALTITDIPFEGPVSSPRVGRINGEWVINPTASEMENSDVDLMVAGTAADINMVEGEMNGISEKEMVEAIKFAHESIKTQIEAQVRLAEAFGKKEVREYETAEHNEELEKMMDTKIQMGKEKVDILKAMGAEVVVCPTAVEPNDPRSYYSVSKRLAEETPNSWYVNQYDNLSNTQAHYESTGPEIWKQTDGKITHFVVGVGTGGTISGVGKYLKEQNPNIKIWGIDTYGSVFKKYHETGVFDENEIYPYVTEGIGEDILPLNVNFSLIDGFTKVTDKDAAIYTQRLAKEEGMFLGNSAGAAIKGLLQLKEHFTKDDVVVVLFHDHGSRYVGKMFNDDWMREQGFI